MKILLFFLVTIFSGLRLSAQPKKVWLDTDIMMGKWAKDVDDGLALIAALRSSEIEILGISLTQDVNYAYKVTQKLLTWYGDGKVIPVHKGAKDFSEAGKDSEAVTALAQALKKEKLTVLSLGPATNIATLLTLHPELESQIEEIVFCMGRKPDAHFNPGNGRKNLSDYNFDLDNKAMERILQTEIKLIFSGYEASSFVHFSKEDILPFKSGNKVDKWVHRQLKSWERLWKIYLGSEEGFIPFDLAALGHLIASRFFKYENEIPLKIQVMENDSRFQNKNDKKLYLLVSYQFDAGKSVDYCYETLSGYKQFILERLLPREK